jgi:hypothetical protein
MVDDPHAGSGLVGRPGQVGALDPVLGVFERVEIAGREGGGGLGADRHAGVFDDTEHLPDAVVNAAHQVPDGGTVEPEGELTGGGALEAHLLLDVGGDHTVALAE